MNIEFKEGAVCFADGKQWFIYEIDKGNLICELEHQEKTLRALLDEKDFQLNTIKQGDYIEASELDTEQKYNDAVEVLGLFGFFSEYNISNMVDYGGLLVDDPVYFCPATINCSDIKRKITYNQLMAIGELKSKMNERENLKNVKEWSGVASDYWETHNIDGTLRNNIKLPSNGRKPKSKEAYRILESMGIEWDEVERKWFKKEWL